MSGKKVYAMLSGGVDSSVAAARLKEQGYDVVGVFMKCWSLEQLKGLGVSEDLYGCFWEDDARDAELVAKKIGIPFEVWDFENDYKQNVVQYMLNEYAIGKTPNPDVMCNSTIKFGVFYNRAMSLGADYVATGHYARLALLEAAGDQKVIARGKDSNKDQSYFLWGIKQKQLDHILFPAGEFASKTELRSYAKNLNLITASKPDSQGLCFIGKTPLRELLLQTLGKQTGQIIDQDGNKLGTHDGAYLYTIGQRGQLGLSGGPWYVVEINIKTNQVIVSHQTQKSSLFQDRCVVKSSNWSVDIDEYLKKYQQIEAQIRYRQIPEKCYLQILDSDALSVTFMQPVRAIAKGQSVVFYSGKYMLGGGVIM
ncbi:MAG: tRNA 2-thiouridine(34) synthase MnmA [Patescibacteria group bacterium]